MRERTSFAICSICWTELFSDPRVALSIDLLALAAFSDILDKLPNLLVCHSFGPGGADGQDQGDGVLLGGEPGTPNAREFSPLRRPVVVCTRQIGAVEWMSGVRERAAHVPDALLAP